MLVSVPVQGVLKDADGNLKKGVLISVQAVQVFGDGGVLVPRGVIKTTSDAATAAYALTLLTTDAVGGYVRYSVQVGRSPAFYVDVVNTGGTATSLDALLNLFNSAQVPSVPAIITDLQTRVTALEANGGGVAGGIQGSVPFVGAGGTLVQDNPAFFFDDAVNRLLLLDKNYTNPFNVLGGAVVNPFSVSSNDLNAAVDGNVDAGVGHYFNAIFDTKLQASGANQYYVGQYTNIFAGGTYSGGTVIGHWINATNERNEGNPTAQIYGSLITANGDSDTASVIGVEVDAIKGNINSSAVFKAVYGVAASGYSPVTTLTAGEFVARTNGGVASTVDTARALHARLSVFNGNTFIEGRGLSLDGWVLSGGGGMDKSVGIYADPSIDAGAVESWFILSDSLSPSQFAGPIIVPEVAYSAAWNGDASVPTKNGVYDALEVVRTMAANATPAIGGAVGGSTVGSVLYVGATNQLAEDNANLFYDPVKRQMSINSRWARVDYLGAKEIQFLIQPDDTQYGFQHTTGANDWTVVFLEADQSTGAANITTTGIELYASIYGAGATQKVIGLRGQAVSLATSKPTEVTGLRYIAGTQSAVGAAAVTGIDITAGARNNGGTIDRTYGVKVTLQAQNGSTQTLASGFAVVNVFAGTGKYTDLRLIDLSGLTAVPVTGKSYGIYMDATIDRGATEKWAIWSASTSPSLLSGNLTIGGAGKFYISTPQTPATAADTGTAGHIAWDANYIYVCVATNTWKRAALATW